MTTLPLATEAMPVLRQLTWLRDPAARQEASLLPLNQTALWTGFRVGIFRAESKVISNQVGENAALAMILRGRTRAQITSRGDRCDFSPGRDSVGVFAPCLDIAWTRWDCEPGAERLMIELNFADLDRAGDLEAMLAPRRSLRQDLTLRDGRLASLMRLIADEVRSGSPHGALYATSLTFGLAAYVFGELGEGGRKAPRERGKLTAAQKACVLDLVSKRLNSSVSLDDLAAAGGMSRFHFLRRFKNTFGVTPYRFVTDQRIEAAQRLLSETDLTLSDVAAATGFSSQSHMGTAMQLRLGVTPGQWRKLPR